MYTWEFLRNPKRLRVLFLNFDLKMVSNLYFSRLDSVFLFSRFELFWLFPSRVVSSFIYFSFILWFSSFSRNILIYIWFFTESSIAYFLSFRVLRISYFPWILVILDVSQAGWDFWIHLNLEAYNFLSQISEWLLLGFCLL